jgi:signal transduction histidine kinase
MPHAIFEDMKRYIGFDSGDARRLASLSTILDDSLPGIVEKFYETLNRHPNARAVFDGTGAQMERQRIVLLQWLRELFAGEYGIDYYERRCRIGRTHVRVELPQHYMFTAMNVVRLSLEDAIRERHPGDAQACIASMHKLLDLELAIMNQTYREDLIARMQQVEHEQYAQRISESEHLATIGQLAASLAHEIKNPLAGISGAIQVLGAALDQNHPHQEIIAESLRQIDRLDEAVKDLLIYARPKPPQTSRTNLSMVLGNALILLREEPSFRDVGVHCDGLEHPHLVEADEAQIHQVMTNLLINAAHACAAGGEIYCRVASVNSVVRTTIQDTGTGMTPEALARAFEPFFTTKSRGTGLGLSIVKRIIEAHNGRLHIGSTPGKGTQVTFELAARK